MGIASLEMGISSWIKKLLPNLRAEYDGSLLPRLDPAWLDSLPPTNHGWVHSTCFVVLWWHLYISKASKYFFTCRRKEWVNIRVRYVTSRSPILIVTTDQLIIYILIARLSISDSKGSVKLCWVRSVVSFYSGALFLILFSFHDCTPDPHMAPTVSALSPHHHSRMGLAAANTAFSFLIFKSTSHVLIPRSSFHLDFSSRIRSPD